MVRAVSAVAGETIETSGGGCGCRAAGPRSGGACGLSFAIGARLLRRGVTRARRRSVRPPPTR